MTTFRIRHRTVLALLALALAFAPRASAQQDVIASMDVDGTNAFLENLRQPPSARDIPVEDGDLVRTGASTSVIVRIVPQGQVQLNQNSAKLITTSFFKGARCVAVRLIAGELFINGENVCFLTNVGAVSGISRSRINVKVDATGTEVTVIEGMAELGGPSPMTVYGLEQLVVTADGEHYKNELDPAEAESTADWTRNYFTAPPPPEPVANDDGDSDAGTRKRNWLGIAAGVILGGWILHEATDDDDGRPSPPQRQDCCLRDQSVQLTPAECRERGGHAGKCPYYPPVD